MPASETTAEPLRDAPAAAGAATIGAASRPPVILQVLPALVTGGVERGTIEVAEAVVRAGGKAIVASSGGPMVRELARIGAEHVELPLQRKNLLTIRRNAGRLERLIRERGVDLIHARSRAPAWSALWAARRTGIPFVTTFHGTYSGAGNPLKRWYNRVMTRGDRVIAISAFIGEHVTQRYRVEPERLRVIPRGVDLRLFDPQRTPAARVVDLTQKWRVPDGMPVVMLPGRLTGWKGQEILIEAVALLGRTDIRCTLLGPDQGRAAYRERLEALIKRRKLQSVVHIVDDCRDMPAAYMLADVVVSASTEPEGFGRVMAEAQAMGKPVIATDHGGAREIIVPGETGWLVPPRDKTALAAALGEALTLTSEERASLSRRAIANVRANFTRELMCERTLAVYQELLGDRSGAGTA
ncbi:MAG: glycosyltransferase family 4 protein [Alphaproteobacteria bacterium]|nr:glycosyltransferase family 4 protein [Alphaproteobacteria bacterium]